MQLDALFRLAFAPAPQIPLLSLATQSKSPAHSSIGTPSPGRVRASTACRHAVSELFHSPPGVLFTFPSRYWFTIGHHGYLALESGLPSFPRDFSCPAVLRLPAEVVSTFGYGSLTLYGGPFQGPSPSVTFCNFLEALQDFRPDLQPRYCIRL